MDIKISNNWLKEYLETKASPKEIADCLSLSGPSVDKITKIGKDYIYDIEVTTNRVDCMSILGIAREGSVILQNAKLKLPKNKFQIPKQKTDLLKIKIDQKLVNRVIAVVMEVGQNTETPKWMKERLEISKMRSLNPIVDITNYIMQEIGHPTHVFDYDRIVNKSLTFRLSKKDEEIITFDGKVFKLPGDDLIIEDGDKNIIDLPGIIGLKNSVVNKNTKRIIFFIDNNDPIKIRKTSTRLGIRTMAAVLNEKGVDPELGSLVFKIGLELYKEICKTKIISKVYDIYPFPYEPRTIKIKHSFIEKIIGIKISPVKVTEILEKLGFKIKFDKKIALYFIKVPSWRANDVVTQEDIVEEVARIYGYQNLPSEIMTGKLPEPILNAPFDFENKIKGILKGYGGIEVYTNSLVPKDFVTSNALALKNPLGEDTKYLRTSLKPSLVLATKENSGEKDPFILFEIANVYLPQKNDLPEERMTLGVIFLNYEYRKAKGVLEALYEELHITSMVTLEERNKFFYFETEVEKLRKEHKEFLKYVEVPKYPAQIEDITLTFPEKTKIGEVTSLITNHEPSIQSFELTDIYKDSYTFRITYLDPKKTLTDKEVEKIREKILKDVREKFGGVVKN